MDREADTLEYSEALVETPFTGVTPAEDVRPATDRRVGSLVVTIDARPLAEALANGVREAARRIEAQAAELTINDQPIARVVAFDLARGPAEAQIDAERIRARYSRELDAEEVNAIRWREFRERLGVSAECPIGNIDLCASHRSDAADALAYAMREFLAPSVAELAESFEALGRAFASGMTAGTEARLALPANRRERRALAAGAKVEDGRIVLRRGWSKKGRDRE